ncbi:MAG TPA: hypothetical protein PLO14_05370 [Accumulibacter sp.]|uniref:hypothetical protein n=1 Tax=Accumulibacter sp. TaxID=2053492 RepID=UPI0025E0A1B2|nr:hypothetical protein [Accumulibacter sp.]MCM8600503.1 hypothetical protein [Accumulibacter sp.]HNC51655.1 hypothetical protein [Accumulibacter sp.]
MFLAVRKTLSVQVSVNAMLGVIRQLSAHTGAAVKNIDKPSNDAEACRYRLCPAAGRSDTETGLAPSAPGGQRIPSGTV